jgi:hypothetical protein
VESREHGLHARDRVGALEPHLEPLGATERLRVRVSSRLHAPGYLKPDLLLKSFLKSFDFDPRLLLVHREALWVERGGSVMDPLDALEESSFWRPVPVIPADGDAANPSVNGGECVEKS